MKRIYIMTALIALCFTTSVPAESIQTKEEITESVRCYDAFKDCLDHGVKMDAAVKKVHDAACVDIYEECRTKACESQPDECLAN